MWILHELDPGASGYNIAASVRFPDGARREHVRRAMESVAVRHPILRTIYIVDRDGAPMQRELDDAAAALWTERSDSDARTQELITDFADRPFLDLAAAPPFRALLIEQDDGSAVVCLVVHHIATDGRSQHVLLRDFSELHQAIVDGRSPVLPPAPPTFAEYLSVVDAEPATDGLGYWTRQLAGGQPAGLPADTPPPGPPEIRRFATELDAERTTALRNLALRRRASFYALLAAAFAVGLSRAAGARDVVFGSVFDGRNDPRFAGTVGFFVNTVAIRARVAPGMTYGEFLSEMQEITAGAARHQDVPFARVVGALRPARSAEQNPLFDVLFVHETESKGADRQGFPAGVGIFEADRATCCFQFEFATQVVDGRLGIAATYPTDRFRRETIAGFTDSFLDALNGFLIAPDVPIGDPLPAVPSPGR